MQTGQLLHCKHWPFHPGSMLGAEITAGQDYVSTAVSHPMHQLGGREERREGGKEGGGTVGGRDHNKATVSLAYVIPSIFFW